MNESLVRQVNESLVNQLSEELKRSNYFSPSFCLFIEARYLTASRFPEADVRWAESVTETTRN